MSYVKRVRSDGDSCFFEGAALRISSERRLCCMKFSWFLSVLPGKT